ncbi:hypothetical protein FDX20_02870, partial [Citrobacter sp. TBCS-11]
QLMRKKESNYLYFNRAFDLKNLMKAHAAQGKTVIFSTHALEVAQQLCDQLAILKAGYPYYLHAEAASGASG